MLLFLPEEHKRLVEQFVDGVKLLQASFVTDHLFPVPVDLVIEQRIIQID